MRIVLFVSLVGEIKGLIPRFTQRDIPRIRSIPVFQGIQCNGYQRGKQSTARPSSMVQPDINCLADESYWLKFFASSFGGTAFEWYAKLKPGSIAD